MLLISVLTATGRQAYGPKVSNIVTQVYMVDAITPVVMVTRKSRPWGGKNGPSSDKKNQITKRGRRNEKIVWPARLPLRYRSSCGVCWRRGSSYGWAGRSLCRWMYA